MATYRSNVILYGGDYNPDQWPPEMVADDLRLMKTLGVNTVTLPVFAWARLQPAEDHYDFGWLDEIMERLAAAGIGVILATPTAAQPAWLSRAYPDVLPVDRWGHRRHHGARTNFCPNSPHYRHFAAGIAGRLAERYRDHPTLRLWHVNNEYGTYCYCDQCAAAFRRWLQARYGSLEELNRRWYTAFWGHTFYDWEEIEPVSYLTELLPGALGDRDGTTNQGMALDYCRFMSDSLLDCFRAEAAAIRAWTPDVPITTNLMGAFKPLDYFAWASELDVVAWDSYPANADPVSLTAARHDLMRGLKGGQPFLLMEQTPNQQNWQPYNALKRPGVMRLWSYQALAHGADAVLFFQWRQSQGACEKYHAAMVAHAGHLETRIGRELQQLGAELQQLGDAFLGARIEARIALIFDWPNWWAVEYSSGPSIALHYAQTIGQYYQALYEANLPVDIISPEMDFTGYDIVIAPLLYLVPEAVAQRVEAFVAAGGTFITTCFSGLVDENDRVYLGGYPGAFRRVLGLWVEETDALYPEQQNEVVCPPEAGADLAGRYRCGLLCDVVHPEGAQVLATFGQDYYAGQPALTEHRFGAGCAVYVATVPEPALLRRLLSRYTGRHGLRPPLVAPAGVEVTQRRKAGRTFTFILNHNTEAVTVPLPAGTYLELLSGTPVTGEIALTGRDVCILQS